MSLADCANTGFTAPSPAVDKIAALIRLGVEVKLNQVWSVDTGFDGRFSGNQRETLFHLDATYRF